MSLPTLFDFSSMNARRKHITTLIYGNPGVGKTTLACSASNALCLDCEDGAYRMSTKTFATCSVVPITSFHQLLNISIDDLKNFDTLVLDTFGAIVKLAIKQLLLPGKISPSVAQWGEVFALVNSFLDRFIGKINIIATAHAQTTDVGSNLNPQKKVIPEAQGSSINAFFNKCDLIGYLSYDENGNRYLAFNGNSSIVCKNSFALPNFIIPDFSTFSSLIEPKISDFITTEISQQKQLSEESNLYKKLWTNFKSRIDNASCPQQFTDIRNDLLNSPDIFALHERVKRYISSTFKLKQFNFVFNTSTNAFEDQKEEKDN